MKTCENRASKGDDVPSRNPVISVRLSDLTRKQIDELTAEWGCSMADVITILADRAYQQEIQTVNSKQAATRIVRIDSKNERIELRAGAKGTGKVLWDCNYWPDSDRSVEEMGRMLDAYVRDNNIELAQDDGVLAPE